MNLTRKKPCFLSAIIWIIIIGFLTVCHENCTSITEHKEKRKKTEKLLHDVFQTKELRVAIENNSSSYFVFNGAPMGYHYELVYKFAQRYNLKLNLIICKTPEEAIELLKNDECDLIAMHLTIIGNRIKYMLFPVPLREAHQVLVQRKIENWRTKNYEVIENDLIRQPLQLAKKTITIPKGSSYAPRIQSIIQEIGDTIYTELSDKTEEQLFDDVANCIIQYTICDDNIATLNGRYYPDVDSKTPVSFKQNTSWAIRKNDSTLCDSLNAFLGNFLQTTEATVIFNNYYRFPVACRMTTFSQHSEKGCITLWDETLQKACADYHLDWKLVAALMYQESKFDTEARGPKGAIGLMQMMPETMARYGVDSLSSPEEQIVSGVKHLAFLKNQFEKTTQDSIECTKFFIAAYNVGTGHILDAQRLAKKRNSNPALWDDVVICLLEKNNPEVYRNNEDVKHGYCKGNITAQYVEEILERYEHYKTIF